MPETTVGTQLDSMLVRVTFSVSPPDVMRGTKRVLVQTTRWLSRSAADTIIHREPEDPPAGLGDVSDALLSLRELLDVAVQIAEPDIDTLSTEELEVWSSLRRGRGKAEAVYEVRSVEMRSPLAIVLEVQPEAAFLLGFGLLALLERMATARTRISTKRAKDLRDKARFDRERHLIEQGRVDMGIQLLAGQPTPDTIEIVSGGEDFDDALPIGLDPKGLGLKTLSLEPDAEPPQEEPPKPGKV